MSMEARSDTVPLSSGKNDWSCSDEDVREQGSQQGPAEEVEVGADTEEVDGEVGSDDSAGFDPIFESCGVPESPVFSTLHANQIFEGNHSNRTPDFSTHAPDLSPDTTTSPAPWKKRKLTTSRKSPLEAVFTRFRDRRTENVVAPEAGMEFDSLQEVCNFFNLYSWEIGFRIRFG